MKMPRYRCWVIAIAVVVSRVLPLAAAASTNVGPKAVSTDKDGTQTWTVGTTTYPVRDFGDLSPTIVYNCAYMPSICKTVNRYLGSLPGAGNERLFHMDINKPRKDARRAVSCPDSWIKDADADGRVPRCPETDQPQWTGYVSGDTSPHGPYPALLSGNPPNPKKPEEPNFNRLGRYEMKFT
ncbi:hypothetical protein DL546_004410 [Coniochaeta pulveracea]|uniref:Secreted protein n=1 Tax=Coniochaeta pulveracea TaxID=177199 RepID=A0A420Y953_9PEZI|nr:hypothetical protein DL546_004410 [Coniochaeta pulveracea]